MIDTVDFLRNLAQLIEDRMGDVGTARFFGGWPGDATGVVLDLTDGRQITLSAEVTR